MTTEATDPPFLPSVHAALDRHIGVVPDQALVVSVSGGCDSVALLRLLLALQPRFQHRLHVLHFNHALRPEADQEEAFVRALAADHELPVHVRRLPLGWQDTASSGGIQERSREWRRAESLALARELDAGLFQCTAAPTDGNSPNHSGEESLAPHNRTAAGSLCPHDLTASKTSGIPSRAKSLIALGHHADDQTETMLLKALRGCHVSNFRGMSWRVGRFVRPLLGVRKTDLRDYLVAIGQTWMEDASNAEPKYKRNKVRLELLPLLEELTDGALLARLQAAEEQSTQLRDWLHQSREAHLSADPRWARPGRPGLSIGRLLSAPEMLQDDLIHTLVRASTNAFASLSQKTLRRVRAQLVRPNREWTVEVPNGGALRRTGDALSVDDGAMPPVVTTEAVSGVRVSHPPSWDVTVGHSSAAEGLTNVPSGAMTLHLRLGARDLTLREWRAGDQFRPRGARSAVALSDFLRSLGLPLDERRRAPLVCRLNSSEVLAVYEPRHLSAQVDVAGAGSGDGSLWLHIGDGSPKGSRGTDDDSSAADDLGEGRRW
jgi:tRNA(Ile)-lysidine synthase